MTSSQQSDSSSPVLEFQRDSSLLKVDFITQLLPYQPILRKVFHYLRPKDLRTVPVVSRNWREAVYNQVPEANRRRLRALKKLKKVKRRVGSENWPITKPPPRQSLRIRESRGLQQPSSAVTINMLKSVQNTGNCNYQLPTPKNCRVLDFGEDFEMSKAANKKRSGWILAQDPFKKW